MKKTAKPKGIRGLRVGAVAMFSLGARKYPVVVMEDRGNLGPKGAQVFGVERKATRSEKGARPERFEVLASDLIAL